MIRSANVQAYNIYVKTETRPYISKYYFQLNLTVSQYLCTITYLGLTYFQIMARDVCNQPSYQIIPQCSIQLLEVFHNAAQSPASPKFEHDPVSWVKKSAVEIIFHRAPY